MSLEQTPRDWYGLFSSHIKGYTQEFVLAPLAWALPKPPVVLRWRRIKFNSANKVLVPKTTRGIYSFIVCPQVQGEPAGEYVFYIGKVGAPDNTRGFRDRYREYLRELSTENPERIEIALGLEQWQNNLWFYWAPIKNAALIDECEKRLIQCLRPPWNKKGKGIPQPPQPAFMTL